MKDAREPGLLLYSFDDITVNRGSAQVRKGGQLRRITPRAFEVLVYLLEHPGRIVQKQELFEEVWKGTFVTDNALTRTIAELRRVIGDSAEEPRYIETATKRGYRFMASVTVLEGATAVSAVPLGPDDASTSENKPEQASLTGSKSLPQSPAAPVSSGSFGEIGRAVRPPARRFFWPAVALLAALIAGLTLWSPFNRLPDTPARNSSPAGPLRTVPFTTLLGQEKWPAFSSDGNQIAFAWEGEGRDNCDIYVKLI
ncbi:MAG: hypothetical protein EHM61_24040 [Acidobacteria bacterium]|nr:MAG: hypothetical protein EHM61_24040 [Acidobacteriota bacterium]